MKNANKIGMLATLVFAVGMVGINFSDGTFMLQNEAPAVSMATGSLLGHLEVIHADSEGNILSYQQTDNVITNDGRNCTAMLLFGGNTHSVGTGCTAQSSARLGVYDIIGIGNGTAQSGSANVLFLNGNIDDNGIQRTQGAVTLTTNATGTDGTTVQRISFQFTWLGDTANPVNQAGLFNQTTVTGSSAFAIKQFPSTVTMNTNDQLTVNWDITIDAP